MSHYLSYPWLFLASLYLLLRVYSRGNLFDDLLSWLYLPRMWVSGDLRFELGARLEDHVEQFIISGAHEMIS